MVFVYHFNNKLPAYCVFITGTSEALATIVENPNLLYL